MGNNKHEALARLVREIGTETRRRINELPKKDREKAWGFVASAIVASAIHDTDASPAVIGVVHAAIAAMIVSIRMDRP